MYEFASCFKNLSKSRKPLAEPLKIYIPISEALLKRLRLSLSHFTAAPVIATEPCKVKEIVKGKLTQYQKVLVLHAIHML